MRAVRAGGFAEDLLGMGREDAAFRAGEVILGEFGDLLEEVLTRFVVEEPGRERLGGSGEAGTGFMGYSFGSARRDGFQRESE